MDSHYSCADAFDGQGLQMPDSNNKKLWEEINLLS
jgi:hypothetical protein